MNYIRLKLILNPFNTGVSELLSAGLDYLGYEGIQEEKDHLLAYIPGDRFDLDSLNRYIASLDLDDTRIQIEYDNLPDRNWNAEWEKDYQPVLVEGICVVRAPFHPAVPGLVNIVIEPKMSFGTGHHETTRLMIKQVSMEKMTDAKILDMGCGTGVLGIFALTRGARHVTAIDIDEWAYTNSLENFERNIKDGARYDLIHGDASGIPDVNFDIILANINRNIILEDMPVYANHLTSEGILIISGILSTDKSIVTERASLLGLNFVGELYDNNWISLKFRR